MNLDDLFKASEAQWKGGKEPTAFPHVCPYRPDGIEKAACIAMSGANISYNQGGCCGTARGNTHFPPCNSTGRRCLACLQMGRRGERANPVADMTTGRCAEHLAQRQTVRPATRAMARMTRPATPLLTRLPIEVPAITPAPPPATQVQGETQARTTARHTDVAIARKTTRGMGSRGKRNIAAIETASAELRQAGGRVTAATIFRLAAKRIGITPAGLKTFFDRYVPEEEARNRLLYGGCPVQTRSQEIFDICLAICEERRTAGTPIDTKGELAEAAAARLNLSVGALKNHLYEKLRHEDAVRLGFVSRCDLQQQIAVLRTARAAMRDSGAPPPRQEDLAAAVAPLLEVTPASARSLIAGLPADIRQELALAGQAGSVLYRYDPQALRRAILGTLDVLALRKEQATAARIGALLKLNAEAVTLYLAENPSIRNLLG